MIVLSRTECVSVHSRADISINPVVAAWLNENTPGYKVKWGNDPLTTGVWVWVPQLHFEDKKHEIMFMLRWRG